MASRNWRGLGADVHSQQTVDEWVSFQFHTLCFQCYRAELDRARAPRLVRTDPIRVRAAVLTFPSGMVDPTYAELDLRRRRAQIVARHVLEAEDAEYPISWQPFVGYAKALG